MLATNARQAQSPAHDAPAHDAPTHRVDVDADVDLEERPVEVVVPRTPEGSEFLGKYDSAGFVDERYLVRRFDGQIVMLSALMYLICVECDGSQDVEGVAAKFGVPPERIVDYLALIGDSVDNIPGVDKVGPKTAAKWIAEHGSLEGVIAAAPQMKGVVGENLRKALDWLPQGRRLVTVVTDCDLSGHVLGWPEFDALALRDIDVEPLLAFYDRYGGMTIVVSRFVPIIRTFAPFVAGVGSMHRVRFSLWNFLGGFAWVTIFVWGGYLFGNVPVIKNNFGIVTILIVLVSVIPVVWSLLRRAPSPSQPG